MDKPQPKLSSGQVVKWKDQDFPSTYANIMGLGMTPFDISLLFGEIGDSTPTEVTGIPKAKIILSPEQAANLVRLIGLALSTYVQNNGKLRNAGAIDMEVLKKDIEAQFVKVGE